MEINFFGLGRLVVQAIRFNPNVRIYQASTSEMFGNAPPPQSEKSPFAPVSPYGSSNVSATQTLCRTLSAATQTIHMLRDSFQS
jgi:GDP-D-mannose dehydratase